MLKVLTMRLIHAEDDTFQVNIALFWHHTPSNVIKEHLWNVRDCAAETPACADRESRIVRVVSLDEQGDMQAWWDVGFCKESFFKPQFRI